MLPLHRAVPPLVCALALAIAPRPASAHVEFFVNDPDGFEEAVADLPLMGVEDWESAGEAAATTLLSPLQPGVAKFPFPNGTNPATGLTVQVNVGGANASVPGPNGPLFFAPAGYEGLSGNVQPSNQLSANTNGHSFDLLFADVGEQVPAAVSFSPMYYRTTSANNSATVEVEVYDGSNALGGSTTVPNVADALETSFLGIVGHPGEIRRVNLWTDGNSVAGADNIRVWAPEPAAGGAAAAALAALAALRGRRRSRVS